MSKRDEVEQLLRRSREFLETAKYQRDSGFYDLAVFSLEQSLQLFLKAKLLANGVDYPRIHSVRRLMRILPEVAKENESIIRSLLDKYFLELGVLDDAYITSRYVTREFVKEEVERLLVVVEEVIRNIS